MWQRNKGSGLHFKLQHHPIRSPLSTSHLSLLGVGTWRAASQIGISSLDPAISGAALVRR